MPLRDVLQKTKNDPKLENQCWTVQAGTTRVKMTEAPAGVLADAQATYTVKEKTAQSGVEHDFSYDPASSTATVNLKNYYLRWLQVTVDQYAVGGKQVGTTQVLGQQSPVDTIMAVPLEPEWSPYQFTWEDQGQPGRGQLRWYRAAAGRRDVRHRRRHLDRDFQFRGTDAVHHDRRRRGPGRPGVVRSDQRRGGEAHGRRRGRGRGAAEHVVGGSVAVKDVLVMIANLASSLLLSVLTDAGASALRDYITGALTESALDEAEPFIGWVALAIGAAADIASIVETSVEVARSPATMIISIERAVDVSVTVTPDGRHAGGTLWPSTATHYTISITYDDGPVYVYDAPLTDQEKNPSPPDNQPKISHTFTGLPAAGTITVLARVYAANGWLAGQGVTKPIPAKPSGDGTLVVASFPITENLVPLSASTTYTFKEKLAFNQGTRVWCAPPDCSAPTATVSDLDGASSGSSLWQLGPLTLNEAKSALGYSWSASDQHVPKVNTTDPWDGQEFTFQSVSEGQNPQSGLMFSGAGWTDKPCLAFPPPTMANPLADGFLLEPNPADESMLLRAISLTQGSPFIASPDQSFGRFTYGLQDLAIHPAGYAVALDTGHCKLEVLRLTTLAADAQAPAAAIYSGKGTRPGCCPTRSPWPARRTSWCCRPMRRPTSRAAYAPLTSRATR